MVPQHLAGPDHHRILQLGGSKAMAGWFLSVYTFASALSAPVMSRACDVRIAWPARGLQTQTFRARQSYRPT